MFDIVGYHNRPEVHANLLSHIKNSDCDDGYKEFLTARVGHFCLKANDYVIGVGWKEHIAIFRSCPPEFIIQSDIDRGIQTAIRDINSSGWIATEWSCAGHAKEIKYGQHRRSHCYLTMIVREENAGKLIRLIQQARKAENPAISVCPIEVHLVNDYMHNDLAGTGFLLINLEHYAVSMDTVYLWRKFLRRLGKLILQQKDGVIAA